MRFFLIATYARPVVVIQATPRKNRPDPNMAPPSVLSANPKAATDPMASAAM